MQYRGYSDGTGAVDADSTAGTRAHGQLLVCLLGVLCFLKVFFPMITVMTVI